MAYINQEGKKKVAIAMNKVAQKYGLKFSLSIRHHSTLVCKIKSGKVDFIGNFNENQRDDERKIERGYFELSEYSLDSKYSGQVLECVKEIISALKSADWYDDSDIQTDYFNTAYYIDIKVGEYDAPYILEN